MDGVQNMAGFLKSLCRAGDRELSGWVDRNHGNRVFFHALATIFAGCGLYGFAIGYWRAPLQGFYSGIKLPLLILLTCLANALLNSILAMVLGSRLSFRQTSLCILLSFALFSLIVGAISPVAFFLTLNLPAPVPGGAVVEHSLIMVIHTFFIAYAGIVGNWKLYQLLKLLAPSPAIAGQTLFAWLAGNLFLGAQLSFVFRPFFGSPLMEVQFLRDNPMAGNFYLVLFDSIRTLIQTM